MIPTPIPPYSPKLRNFRFQVDVCGPRNERGGRKVIETARFLSDKSARTWADEIHPDAEVVNVTLYSALRGWKPEHAAQRKDGEWVTR